MKQHPMIALTLAPFNEFPRITRIEDLNELQAVTLDDIACDYPSIDSEQWLDDDSIESVVSQNIQDTMNSISADLRYTRGE